MPRPSKQSRRFRGKAKQSRDSMYARPAATIAVAPGARWQAGPARRHAATVVCLRWILPSARNSSRRGPLLSDIARNSAESPRRGARIRARRLVPEPCNGRARDPRCRPSPSSPVYGIMVYNGLVGVKHAVARAWANIDVLLKQRHDEIPKLVERESVQAVRAGDAGESRPRARPRAGAREKQESGRSARGVDAPFEPRFALRPSPRPIRSSRRTRASCSSRTASASSRTHRDRRELYNEAVNVNNVAHRAVPRRDHCPSGRLCSRKVLEFDAASKADVDVKSLFTR